MLQVRWHVLALAAMTLACGDASPRRSYIETGDLEALRNRGTVRLLAPRGAEVYGLPRQTHFPILERRFAESVVRSLGLEPVWVWVDSHEDLVPMLLEGRGDVIVALYTITEPRREAVAFSRPIITVQERAVTHQDSAVIQSVADLVGRSVAVRRSSSYWETLDSLRQENSGIEVVRAPEDMSTADLLDGVAHGRYDVTIADDILVEEVTGYLPTLRADVVLRRDRRIGWAVRPNNPELLDAVNPYIDELKLIVSRTGREFGDLPEIEERGVLRVLTRNNAATYFIWRGELVGFEHDLAMEFGRQHGLAIEFLVAPSHERMLVALAEGFGDVIAAGITRTPDRQDEGFAFSRPYNKVVEMVVGRLADSSLRSPQDLSGRTIVTRPSSSYWATAKRLQQAGFDFDLVAAPAELETEEVIERVAQGVYDLTIADSHILSTELAWRDDVVGLFPVSDSVSHAWVVREDDEELRRAIDEFFAQEIRGTFYNLTYEKYFGGSHRQRAFVAERSGRTGTFSPYDSLVQHYATQYGFDWLLITSQMYQESRFDPNARSFAGAVGLMQVLPSTAKGFGFDSLEVPRYGIHAGVFYLDRQYGMLADVRAEDRVWFALAAYNAGFGHVDDARLLANRLGKDPDTWFGHVADVMPLLARREYASGARYGYCRCTEPVRYVVRIRDRWRGYAAALRRVESGASSAPE
jgi:membrane-bound lytic murein transglycosylase F